MRNKSKKEILNVKQAIKKANMAFKTNMAAELTNIVEKKKKEVKYVVQKKRKMVMDIKKDITEILREFDPKTMIKEMNTKIERFNKALDKKQQLFEKKISKIRKLRSTCHTEMDQWLKELRHVESDNLQSVTKCAMGIQKSLEKFTHEKDNACDKIFQNITKNK